MVHVSNRSSKNRKLKEKIFGIIVIFGDIRLLNFFITMHLSVNDERTRFQLPARLQATFFCDSSLYVGVGANFQQISITMSQFATSALNSKKSDCDKTRTQN